MNLRKSAVNGTIWTSISYGFQAVTQILRLSILTRYLDKSDFGLVAIVVLVLGFTRIFADLGVSVSLFSKEKISRTEYSSLYWVGIILSIFLYVVLICFCPLIARFYSQPSLVQLIPIMGLDLIFTSAGRQFRIFQQKSLQFKFLAFTDILTSIVSIGVAIVLAVKGFGVYSLVYSTIFASFSSSLVLIISGIKTHPLFFYINLKEGRSFYRIGLYQTGAQICDYIASQMDVIIIGKILPVGELGVYNLVKQFTFRIYNILNPVLTSVFTPVLAKLQGDIVRLKEKYLTLLQTVGLMNVPIYATVAIFSTQILTIMYGAAYAEYSFMLQIFCVWGAILSVASVSSVIATVTGRTDLNFRWTLFRIIYNPLFVLVGATWGAVGVVIGQSFYALSVLPLYWFILIRKIMPTLGLKAYLSASIKGAVISAGIICIVIFTFDRMHFADSILRNIVIWLIYVSLFLALNFRGIKNIYELVRERK
ncbi:MOP flippase family protein [Olivibacter sp. XZL3]|uniref:MOP flippase family protein n=1 Tax=Olivibacter sp. XZL3 TaxID=1735116 RepID=UPI0010655B33|nr:MOP flippase family protein [Olivibacter sp. XZL3]